MTKRRTPAPSTKQRPLYFEEVFAPLAMKPEGKLGPYDVHYTLETAARVMARTDIQTQIRAFVEKNKKIDIGGRNDFIAKLLTEFMLKDLKANAKTYAHAPATSPVPFLADGQPEENEAIIKLVIKNAPQTLQDNVMNKKNVTRYAAKYPGKKTGWIR